MTCFKVDDLGVAGKIYNHNFIMYLVHCLYFVLRGSLHSYSNEWADEGSFLTGSSSSIFSHPTTSQSGSSVATLEPIVGFY